MRMSTFSGDDLVKTAYIARSEVQGSTVEILATEPDESPFVTNWTVIVLGTGSADLVNGLAVVHNDSQGPPSTLTIFDTLPPDGMAFMHFPASYLYDAHILASCVTETTAEVRIVVH